MDPDFDMKRSLVEYIKQNNFLPKLESDQVSLEKLIHHIIEIDTMKILEYERKSNSSIYELEKSKCDFITSILQLCCAISSLKMEIKELGYFNK